MSSRRIIKNVNADTVSSNSLLVAPSIPIDSAPAIAGSIAFDPNTQNLYYGNGTSWSAPGGSSAEIGIMSILDNTGITSNAGYQKVIFDTDETPPIPHPSIQVDVGNSQFVILQPGVFSVDYRLNPDDTETYLVEEQAPIYLSQININRASPPSDTLRGLCYSNGGTKVSGGIVVQPSGQGATLPVVPKVTNQGSWTGVLAAGDVVTAVMAVATSSPTTIVFVGEGGGYHEFKIVKVAPAP